MKNLKFLLLIVFLTFSLLTIQAQNKIGIRAGYQSSGFYKDGAMLSGTDPYSSFYAGLFKDNRIIPALHFGVGLEYFQNGASYPDDKKLVLRYLAVPIYLKVKLGPVFALTGIGANFKISEKMYAGTNPTTPAHETNMVDFPVFVGGGFKILMFTIEGRYHWGLTDINNGASSRYLQLGAAISF